MTLRPVPDLPTPQHQLTPSQLDALVAHLRQLIEGAR